MSFDSGNWRKTRLKHLVSTPIKNGLGEAARQDDPAWPRYIRTTDIADPRHLRRETFKSLPPGVAAAAMVEPGDLLLSAAGSVGKSFLVPDGLGPACFAGYLVRIRAAPGTLPGFLAYWAESASFISQVEAGAVQSTIQNFSATRYGNLLLRVPPEPIQKSIANFLDRETERIDRLVEKKQRLIELLEEKRTALISHAVTKGLDSTVTMKDSGIPWLGEIPAHWDAVRIKYVARPGTGHTPSRQHPEYWEGTAVPWFTLADVWQLRDGWREVVDETSEKVSEIGLANSSAVKHPAGTVFFSRTASIGFSGIMGREMATSQDFVTWTCSSVVDPHFLLYVFRAMKPEFARLTMGSTHQTIYMPDALGVSGPLPPLSEQEAIVEFLRPELHRIHDATVKLRTQLAKLAEYRQALITAAVTGQIDVEADRPDPEEVVA